MFSILIVEDDLKLAQLLQSYMEKYGGRAEAVQEFDQVMEVFQDIRPDLVLLDVNLPVLSKIWIKSVGESQFKLKYHTTINADTTLHELNCSKKEDLAFIKRMVLSRRPISEQFGVSNNQGLFMF
ncbi:hypothetical protein GCM10010912_68880 [Paenibacillus albidus]|uniref:Response regulatory domain-containing protein n=1 Tax=Paenibacillus albidus TaxID=2041023 RepID=A0A917FYW7_9BACL|nr:hypothetical protein GCM10010912_68880 [Paenibacillus albidus]